MVARPAPVSGVEALAGAGELARLWAQCEPGEPLDAETLREKLLEDPHADPALWLAARRGGQLVGAAVGVARPSAGGGRATGYVQFLAVAPAFRRQGVATRLLDELERRLWERGVASIRAFGGSPSYLWPGVDVRYTPALCLLERRGYRIEGYEFNMAVSTAEATRRADGQRSARTARLSAAGIVVRPLVPEDREPFAAWLEQHWGPNWTYEALLALRREPPSGFVAVREGKIVAFAVFDSTRPGWLGPMGVQPDLQANGVGTELCLQCLEAMGRRGYEVAEIAWAGPRCFYARKVGAVISRVFATMVRRRQG